MRHCAGLGIGLGNLLARGASPLTVSDSDPLYPPANLIDGLPSRKFRNLTNGANRTAQKDLTAIANGTFETSTLASWLDGSTGSGTTAEDTGLVHSGSKALKCGGGASGSGVRYVEWTVRSGERRNFEAFIAGDGSKFARIQLQNRHTGRYLQAGGASWGAAADLFTRSANSYAPANVSYRVEDWTACQTNTLTLRLSLYCNENGFGWFDDVADWPAHNFMGSFGHNHAPCVAPQYWSSSDNFGASNVLEVTMTPHQPAYYGFLPVASNNRYVRRVLAGTNTAPPEDGELVLCYVEQAGHNQLDGYTDEYEDPQLRSAGGEYAILQRQADQLGFKLPSEHVTDAEYLEMVQDILRRSRFGADTSVFVPRDGGQQVVLGRLRPSDAFTITSGTIRRHEQMLEPLPFASVVG